MSLYNLIWSEILDGQELQMRLVELQRQLSKFYVQTRLNRNAVLL